MHRFLPLAVLALAACEPAAFESADGADAWTLTAAPKTATKTTSTLLPCYDKDGNPINQTQPHCVDQARQVTGSVSPNSGHDPYFRLSRLAGADMYFARGVDGTALVGAGTSSNIFTITSLDDTSSASLAVFAPPGAVTRVTTVDLRGRLTTAEVPATVSFMYWGDFRGTELVAGEGVMARDGLTDVMMVLDNGETFLANGNQGPFVGAYEMEY